MTCSVPWSATQRRCTSRISFTARYVDGVGAVDPAGRWTAAVDLTWRFDGFDTEPVHEEMLVGFQLRQGQGGARSASRRSVEETGARRSGSAAPSSCAGPATRWCSLPPRPRQTWSPAGPRPQCRSCALCSPQWEGKLVVEVPGSEEALAAALGAEPGSYTDIAAVTASVDGTITPDSEVHVFVNPDVYDDLEPVGGQVVISHEATHLATDAPLTSGVPLWLLEGFAGLRRPARRRPADHDDGRPDHPAGPRGRSPRTTCRASPSSTRPTRTSGRRTRARGWPAWCSPTRADRTRWCSSTSRSRGARDLAGRLDQLFGLTEAELTARCDSAWRDLAARSTEGT